MKATIRVSGFLMALLVLLSACTPEAEPIHYGHDNCAHCMMTITDQRYGSELVTKKGRVFTFDSVECLAAYLAEGKVAREDVHALLVTDFKQPGTLIPVEDAFFLHSPTLRSPMGMNLTAFGHGIRREAVVDSFGGDVLGWEAVLALVDQQAGTPASHTGH